MAAHDADLDDSDVAAQAKSAEDRKAAAALASLDTAGPQSANKHVDLDAVNKAMQNLQLGAAAGSRTTTTAAAATAASAKKTADEKAAAIRKVKVDAADVALLVNELDLTKAKATDLLKHHEGSAIKAIQAFIAVH